MLRSHVRVMLGFVAIIGFACQDDQEDKKKITVSTSLRSTGNLAIEPTESSFRLLQTSGFIANSNVTVTAFEIPIGRINLTAGDTGSGYTEASPNFYTCPGTTNDDCMVDVINTSIEDLLADYVSGALSVEFPEAKTYTGTSVELCAEGQGGEGTSFQARITASAILGDTTYYTNATTGVSVTGPAEATEITMACMGRNTDLVNPVEIAPETAVDLTFWAEPAGAVLITNDPVYINANCTSDTAGTVAFCATSPFFFGTTVAGDASSEDYLLEVTTTPSTAPNASYADMLATVVFNADGVAFGGSLKQVYTNAANQRKLMHGPLFSFDAIEATDDSLTFKYGQEDGSKMTIIDSLPRSATGTGITISELVDETVELSSTKL